MGNVSLPTPVALAGGGVKDEGAVDDEGRLCGTWRRADDAAGPQKGDRFLFVTLNGGSASDGGPPATVIYGDVVP